MCDFWSSVTLVSGRYEGRPMAAHLRLKGVRPEHFDLWLRLFRQTAGEVCSGDVAAVFILRAERIAESFQLGMFFRPENPGSFPPPKQGSRSEEHTSELQSLMRISYAVFCLKKKNI